MAAGFAVEEQGDRIVETSGLQSKAGESGAARGSGGEHALFRSPAHCHFTASTPKSALIRWP
jgi:hypothetical protein